MTEQTESNQPGKTAQPLRSDIKLLVRRFIFGDYPSFLLTAIILWLIMVFCQFTQCIVDGFKEFYDSIVNYGWTFPITKSDYLKLKKRYRIDDV